jgi:hypothetical protein
VNVSYKISLRAYRPLMFTDDSTPFTRLRDAGEANPTAGHMTKSTSRARAATSTITNSNRRAVHLPSKRGQAVRAAPVPMVGSTKKSSQITPPTRPTGWMASTSRIGPVSAARLPARPATSVSLRPW